MKCGRMSEVRLLLILLFSSLNTPKMKQVIIIRTDLNMSIGQICVRSIEASLEVFIIEDPNGYTFRSMSFDTWQWLNTGCKKICLGVDSKNGLENLYVAAFMAGLPCSIIRDQNEFIEAPTSYMVAIGPAEDEDIEPIIKGLKLL